MKICTIILVIVLLISCSGCSLLLEGIKSSVNDRFDSVTSSNADLSDAMLQQLTAAISEKDEQTLYQMFSPNAISSSEGFDENVAALMEFWEGNVVSNKRYGPRMSAKKDGRLYRKEIYVAYDVNTDKESYRLAFWFCVADSWDAGNIGIMSLYITKNDDPNPDRAYRNDGVEWIYGVNIE